MCVCVCARLQKAEALKSDIPGTACNEKWRVLNHSLALALVVLDCQWTQRLFLRQVLPLCAWKAARKPRDTLDLVIGPATPAPLCNSRPRTSATTEGVQCAPCGTHRPCETGNSISHVCIVGDRQEPCVTLQYDFALWCRGGRWS